MLRWLFIGFGTIVAVLVIGSFALSSFQTGGGGQSSIVEGVGTSARIEGADHVPVGDFVTYQTVPPTSGNHWPAPSGCGIIDAQVPDETVVHNMEHGHVVISYNLPDPEAVAALVQVAEGLSDLDRWGIVRPYSKIAAGTVAVTAWGVLDTMEGVDAERITTFYDTYRRNRFSDETARVGPIACRS